MCFFAIDVKRGVECWRAGMRGSGYDTNEPGFAIREKSVERQKIPRSRPASCQAKVTMPHMAEF